MDDPQEAVEMFLPTYNPARPQTQDEMLRELAKIPGFTFKPKS